VVSLIPKQAADSTMAPDPTSPSELKKPGMLSNMNVDYVLTFRFTDSDKAEATKTFGELVRALAKVGLATEVRNGESHSLLLFVKVASDEHLFGEVYRSRYAKGTILLYKAGV
jgi:anoctamin-10